MSVSRSEKNGRIWLAGSSALLLALAAIPARAQQAASARTPLTVERIYGQPSLNGSLTRGLQWSADGKLLSYLERSGSGRDARTEVWVMEVGRGERRALLDTEKLKSLVPAAADPAAPASQQTGLGRLTPHSYFWSPTGKALLFVSQGDLYWWDLEAQGGKRLTRNGAKQPAGDAKISPDGKKVSFVRNFDLWVVQVATSKEKRLTRGGREELMNGQLDWVYPEELGITTAHWWSPDSRQIAYLEMDERPVKRYPLVDYLSYTGETEWMRYPKAGDANPIVRVGVVAAKGGKTRWMDTGRETDIYIARVNWLRDARRLAMQRLNRAQNRLDLLIGDAATGKTRVALAEEDPHWINLSNDLYFLKDGRRMLWSSERDGFRHLYLYDLDGKLLKQLTRGAWEVTRVAGVDENSGTVYYLATEKSPLERHLYKVGLEGGEPVRVTSGDGSHGVNLSPDAAHYVDTYSHAMMPPRQELCSAEGRRVQVINENRVAELEQYTLQKPEFLRLQDAGLGELQAMMIKPPDFNPARKYPALMYTYGGPASQVVQNAWGGNNFLWHQMMAQKGYVIFLVDNGGSAARGHRSETPMHRRLGEVELAEVAAGANYLKSLPYVDGNRIGLWGWSYGGYLTTMAMVKAPGVFRAAFAGAPVTDWRHYDTIYTERYMGRPQDNGEGYVKSAPATHAAQLKGKLLIAHGTGDDNVHYANTVKLGEEIIKAGKYAEVLFYPGRGHGIGDPVARIHLFNRVTQFFLDNLSQAGENPRP